MALYFITGNKNKFAEAKGIVPELEQLEIDLPEIQQIDPRLVIEAKLLEARKRHDGALVVEDTSLSLDCLNGLPGPLIKWFLEAMGNAGLADLAERYSNHAATARTVIGYCDAAGRIEFFEGSLRGNIVAPTGKSGFGWDPVFAPKGATKSFQQMTREEKNAMSMRGQAFRQLADRLRR